MNHNAELRNEWSTAGFRFIANSIKQPSPRFLYHIQYVFKALVSTKIRIGHFGYAFRKLFAILHQQPKFMAVLRGTFPLEYGEIALVHRQNIMKNLEIPLMYLSRTQFPGVIATPHGRSLGPLIRRLASVKIMGTSGIDINRLFKAGGSDLMSEHRFRSR